MDTQEGFANIFAAIKLLGDEVRSMSNRLDETNRRIDFSRIEQEEPVTSTNDYVSNNNIVNDNAALVLISEVRRLREEMSNLSNASNQKQTEVQSSTPNNTNAHAHTPIPAPRVPPSTYIKEALYGVPMFDGRNFTQFSRACRRALDMIPSFMEQELVILLKGRVSSSAYIAVEKQNFDTVADFLQRLNHVFCSRLTVGNLRGKLDAIRKFEHEPIIQYANRVVEIRDEIVEKRQLKLRDELSDAELIELNEECVNAFRAGLPRWFRNQLFYKADLDLNDIIDDAISVEQEIQRDVEKHGASCFIPQNVRYPRYDSGRVSAVGRDNREGNNFQARDAHRNNDNDRRDNNPSNAGRTAQNNNSNVSGVVPKNNSSDGEINKMINRSVEPIAQSRTVCSYCQKPGHHADQCYSRLNRIKRSENSSAQG